MTATYLIQLTHAISLHDWDNPLRNIRMTDENPEYPDLVVCVYPIATVHTD